MLNNVEILGCVDSSMEFERMFLQLGMSCFLTCAPKETRSEIRYTTVCVLRIGLEPRTEGSQKQPDMALLQARQIEEQC